MGIREMNELQALKQRRDVTALVAVLGDEAHSATERRFAAAALGDLRARQAVPDLAAALDDPEVWDHAMKSLVKIGDPIAAAAIVELMYTTTDRFERKKAQKALKRLHDSNPDEVREVLEAYETAKARRDARQAARRKRR